ncbi:MAG: winged helix DNA-binding protein [Rhodobiaceae bacterium]|nr:winged helix DNA-binding protein [Rhodobiaceae bacterium]
MIESARVAHLDKAPDPASMETLYMDSLRLIERLHRRLLDVIKDEFDRRGRNDVNSVQALLIYNIGDSELTAGELKTRGYYLGSNVSYNLKKLVDMGYICHERSKNDRRAVRVSLSDLGHEVRQIVQDLYDKHLGTIEPVGDLHHEDFACMNKALLRLERFWTDQIRYRL